MTRGYRAPFLFPAGVRLGVDNVVLQGRATRHKVDAYAGPLSIKTVIRGEVAWTVGGRELVVDPSSFLILSAGETYSMNIAALRPVETCCVFFAPGFVERIALDATSPLDTALIDPERTSPALPYLSAWHSDPGGTLPRRVQTLAVRCTGALMPSGFEEDFLLLGAELLQLYERIREESARVPAIRESTRQELFRRLLAGREYIHSHSSGPVSLNDIARAACLSPFHFHRGFRQAFQQTPHTYLTRLRLDRARGLLDSGSTVLEACLATGFSSPSAFSRLFRSTYGEVPSGIRRKFARSGKNGTAISGRLTA